MTSQPTLLPRVQRYSILITTMTIGERPAVSTTIAFFDTIEEAVQALMVINEHYDSENRYEQVAIPLFR